MGALTIYSIRLTNKVRIEDVITLTDTVDTILENQRGLTHIVSALDERVKKLEKQ